MDLHPLVWIGIGCIGYLIIIACFVTTVVWKKRKEVRKELKPFKLWTVISAILQVTLVFACLPIVFPITLLYIKCKESKLFNRICSFFASIGR